MNMAVLPDADAVLGHRVLQKGGETTELPPVKNNCQEEDMNREHLTAPGTEQRSYSRAVKVKGGTTV